MKTRIATLLLATALLSACEKPYIDEASPLLDEQTSCDEANVHLYVRSFEIISFEEYYSDKTRATTDISKLCSRISYGIFKDDVKVGVFTQKISDANFGTLDLKLETGTYKVVVIAHNGNGNATITSPNEIKFANNQVTDTFSACIEIEVEAGDTNTPIDLKRVVAMFSLTIEDEIPENIKKMHFFYTGGSSTLDAETGLGCVESRQTATINLQENQNTFNIYTFPHTDEDVLKITVNAIDVNGLTVEERLLDGVPVQRNKVTLYSGNFFDGHSGESSTKTITLQADGEWDGTINGTF